MSMSIDKVIEILESGKAPETEQDFEDFDTAMETAINLLKTHPDNQPNKPLTIAQLREMDGEPVWLVWAGHPQAGWALVRVWSKSDNVIYLAYNNGVTDIATFVLNDGGKIYRRKPEEGAV